MNIFVLDEDPYVAASMQCDAHVVKMILESALLLSTAARELTGYNDVDIYKSTHINHPCSIWLRESFKNVCWLYLHAQGLLEEYTRRYNKVHKSEGVIDRAFDIIFNNTNGEFLSSDLTPYKQAMPDKFKDDDAVMAYRNYYKYDKLVNIPRFNYKLGNKPKWL